jgi:8-oxo-dGTP diphosphatase
MEEPKILKDPPPPKYVVGFLFNHDYTRVALIQKTKPLWQNGLMNGIGGKTEPGETALQAMSREFMEETGVEGHIDWQPFASFHSGKCDPSSPNQVIACFTASTDDITFYSVKTTTEEVVYTVNVRDIPTAKTVPNLKWLIPLALDFHRDGGMKSAVIYF